MAGPLTWQDVAGQINVNNYADTSALITQGIAGVGDAVAKLGGAKDARQKADLANKMMLLDMQAEAQQKHAALGSQLGKDLEARDEKKYSKEFGANQSALEELARTTIANGGSMDDVMKSDLFQNLSEGARSFAGPTLSNAAYQGTNLRDRRAEVAQNNRVQEAQLGLSRRNTSLAEAAAERAIDADVRAEELHNITVAEKKRIKREVDAEDLRLRGGLKRGVDETTEAAMEAFRELTGRRLADISGGQYTGQAISKVAEEAGFSDHSAASNRFNEINRIRIEQNKDKLPDTVLAALLAKQDGKNNWFGMYDTFDEDAFDSVLEYQSSLYDRAQEERALLQNFTTRANAGETITDKMILEALTGLEPAMEVPKVAPKPYWPERPGYSSR